MSTIFKYNIAPLFLIFLFSGMEINPTFNNSDDNKKIDFHNEYELLQENKVIYISIEKQRLYIFYKQKVIKEFDISSSIYGVGFESGSLKTPSGLHYIKKKIGDDVPLNGIFKYRQYSGEVSIPNHPSYMEKDLITTRILWLSGSDEENEKSYKRCIYIHGTPEEIKIGQPSSHGCIRMKNSEVYALYEFVENGTPVLIR
jgi:lipoprotein-anchoring transpeptidase ErfK/SrfK